MMVLQGSWPPTASATGTADKLVKRRVAQLSIRCLDLQRCFTPLSLFRHPGRRPFPSRVAVWRCGGGPRKRRFCYCKDASGGSSGDPHIQSLRGAHYSLLKEGAFLAWSFSKAPVEWQLYAHYAGWVAEVAPYHGVAGLLYHMSNPQHVRTVSCRAVDRPTSKAINMPPQFLDMFNFVECVGPEKAIGPRQKR